MAAELVRECQAAGSLQEPSGTGTDLTAQHLRLRKYEAERPLLIGQFHMVIFAPD